MHDQDKMPTNIWIAPGVIHESFDYFREKIRSLFQVLSICARFTKFSILQSYIPGLSARSFTNARTFANLNGPGAEIKTEPITRTRFSRGTMLAIML